VEEGQARYVSLRVALGAPSFSYDTQADWAALVGVRPAEIVTRMPKAPECTHGHQLFWRTHEAQGLVKLYRDAQGRESDRHVDRYRWAWGYIGEERRQVRLRSLASRNVSF
jgi:hypothetical protein